MVPIIVLMWLFGPFMLFCGLLWLLYRVTSSPWGRWGTTRWWCRALPILMGFGLVLTFSLNMPALILPVLGMIPILSVLFWRFLHSMARRGSALQVRVNRLGWGMCLAWLGAALLGLGGGVLTATTGMMAQVGIIMLVLAGLVSLFSNLPLMGLLIQIPRYWPLQAGKPVAHLQAVAEHLRKAGELLVEEERHLIARVDGIEVEMDIYQCPLRIVLSCPLDGMPPDLMVASRQEGDPPGIQMDDPLLGQLLTIQSSDPELVRAAFRDQHELLLSNLHAWPGSRIENNTLYVEMTGPPFVPEGRVDTSKNRLPISTVQALREQLQDVHRLKDALSKTSRMGQASARRHHTPIGMTT